MPRLLSSPIRLTVITAGAAVFAFGVASSDLEINMFPLGLGFLMIVVGACYRGRA